MERFIAGAGMITDNLGKMLQMGYFALVKQVLYYGWRRLLAQNSSQLGVIIL